MQFVKSEKISEICERFGNVLICKYENVKMKMQFVLSAKI